MIEILKELEGVKFVGIGSGRTIKNLISTFPEELKSKIICFPTSHDTKMELIRLGGFQVGDLESVTELDITIDGFDSINCSTKTAIKGGGGCMTWEKLVAHSSKRLILIGQEDKVEKKVPVPVEVLSMACGYVQREISKIGMNSVVRQGTGKLGPVVTDFGNWILDVDYSTENMCQLHEFLKQITGVVETGIFTLPFQIVIFKSTE